MVADKTAAYTSRVGRRIYQIMDSYQTTLHYIPHENFHIQETKIGRNFTIS
jgi:hypothetical protein